MFSQNLESKLASCREYVQEQTANRKAHAGGQGATSSHNNPSENSTTNGLYSKGCVEARNSYSVFFIFVFFISLYVPIKLQKCNFIEIKRCSLAVCFFLKDNFKLLFFSGRWQEVDVLSECLRCCCCFQAGEEVGLRVGTQTATVKPKTSRQVVWDALIGSGGLVLHDRHRT